nr:linear gramicidin synthetase subunit D [bacterium]
MVGVLQRQHDLEERVPGQRPGRVQHLHEAFERQILMRVRGQIGLPHPAQQLLEARVAGRVGPQHQRVDEEPDQIVDRVVGPARDRRADRNVGAGAEAGEQRRECGLHHHEQRGPGLPGQRGQAGVQAGVDGEGDRVTAVRGDRRARPVGRQVQLLGQIRQRLGPVRQLGLDHAVRVVLVAENLALPQGVVRVLHRQRRVRRHGARTPGPVRHGQVPRQRPHRPGVRGDVVRDQQQYELVGGQAEQPHPDRQLAGQVELVSGGLAQALRQLLGRAVGHGEDRGDRGDRQHHLDRSRRVLGEDGVQALVADDHVAERQLQCGHVQLSAQAHGDRHVVGRGWSFQAVQEPQPLLGEGQRHPLGPWHDRLQPATPGPRGVQPVGQPGHGRRVEQLPDRQLDVQHRPDPADQPGGQQRMPAEVEERVVDAHLGHPEDLGEQTAQDLLAGVPRTPPADRHRGLRRGQLRPVHLAVHGQRELVHRDDRGRHHVLGQHVGHRGPQRPGVEGDAAGRLHVPHQARVARLVLADHHHRPAHPGPAGQRGLDLAQFDPETAHLHLVVGAPHELQRPGLGPPHHVAGAVHPRAGRAERVGHEAFAGQARPAQVAAGQSGAGHIELAGHADRHRLQAGVEYVRGAVDDRRTDRWCALGVGAEPGTHGGAHGRLGRAVGVDHASAAGPAAHDVRAAGLARDDHGDARRHRPGRHGGQRAGRERHVGDPARLDQGGQRLARHQPVVDGHHHGGTGQPGHHQLGHHRVEARGGELQDPRGRRDGERLALALDQAGYAAVRHGHTLGGAGRARGVDDVRQLLRPQRGGPLPVVEVGVRAGFDGGGDVGGVEEHRRGPAGRDPSGLVHRGEDQPGCGVVEHEADPVGRRLQVDRQVRRTGLEDRQDRDGELWRPWQGHRHAALRAGAAAHQVAGQAVGAGVQFGVREGGVLEDQRRGGTVPGHLALEEVRQRLRGNLAGGVVDVHREVPVRGRVEGVDPAGGAAGLIEDGVEDAPQDVHHLGGAVRAHRVRAVVEPQVQPGARGDDETERVVRRVVVVDGDAAQPGRVGDGVETRVVQRIVLEHHRGVEEFAHAGERADPAQRQVLVVEGVQLFALDAGEQRADRLGGPQRHPQRHRVDEQADHPFDAGQFGRAAGHGDPEDHVLPAGDPGEGQRPGRLDHDVGRDAEVAGLPGEPVGDLLGEVDVDPFGIGGAVGAAGRADQGGRFESGQRGLPFRLGDLLIAVRQPGQVVPVRRGGRAGHADVEREQVVQHDRHGPAVQDDVMVRDHEPVPLGVQPDQQEPDQRRRAQVEPGGPLLQQGLLDRLVLVVAVQVTQVGVGPAQRRVAVDELHPLPRLALAERGAQRRVPSQDLRRALLEPCGVQAAFEHDRQLFGVRVLGLLVVDAVEEQALLQRRQGQDVFDAACRLAHAVRSPSA